MFMGFYGKFTGRVAIGRCLPKAARFPCYGFPKHVTAEITTKSRGKMCPGITYQLVRLINTLLLISPPLELELMRYEVTDGKTIAAEGIA